MKYKNWLFYLVYFFVILCYFIGSNILLSDLRVQASLTYNAYPLFIISIINYIVIGGLIGFEKLYFEIKKQGKWKINIPKIIVLGIPFLYLSLGVFIYYGISPYLSFIGYPIKLFLNSEFSQIYQALFQILLGYIVITSFYKEKNDSNIDMS